MPGRAAFVYHASSVDTIGLTHTARVLTARNFFAAVMSQIFVNNRDFFIHRLHWTPSLIVIVLSRLDKWRHTQSTTEMSPLNRGHVLHSFNCTPAFVVYVRC